MSWSVKVKGNAEAIGKAFDEQRVNKEKQGGAPVGELENIDNAAELAMITADFAEQDLEVSAFGNWTQPRGQWRFGELHMQIKLANQE